MFLNAAYHVSVYEGAGRRILYLHDRATGLRFYLDLEIGIGANKARYVVRFVTTVEHRQSTQSKQFSHLGIRRHEALNFTKRQEIQRAHGTQVCPASRFG